MMHAPVLGRRDLIRELGRLTAAVAAWPLANACGGRPLERLELGPATVPAAPEAAGLRPLGLGGERDGVRYVPTEPRGSAPPLVLLLHGAGGTGRRIASLMMPFAEETGSVLLAPDSRGSTWDAVTSGFGRDARFIEQALSDTRARVRVDSDRLAVAGFSDGGTYALGLGRANGGVFSHILAFSPGFLIPVHTAGSPRIFVAHGRDDQVLPIDASSRVLVPKLRHDGYDVRYREFDGGHEMQPAIVREALGWFLGRPG